MKNTFAVEVTAEKTIVAGIGALVAPWITAIYGNGRFWIIAALLALIVIDWLTGIAASMKDKTYSSDYGRHGILRTIFLIGFPAASNILDNALGSPGLLFYAVTFGLIYHTWQSLTANAVRAGWGSMIPQSVIDHVSSELKAKASRADQRTVPSKEKGEDSNAG